MSKLNVLWPAVEDQLDGEPKKWMSTKQEKGNLHQISHERDWKISGNLEYK